MNVYEEVGMKIHTLLTSPLDGGECSDMAVLLPGEDPPYLLCKMGPIELLKTVAKVIHSSDFNQSLYKLRRFGSE
jgi:hypothetical protein